MIIREATIADQEAFVDLGLAFMRSGLYPHHETNRAQLTAVFCLVLEHGVFYIAEDDHGVAGGIALAAVPIIWSGERYADELLWFVYPARRGSSAAARLLDAAEKWCRQRRLFSLRMVQPASSPAVARLYQRRGYEALETAWLKRFE